MTITSQHGPWSNFDIKFIHFQDMSWPDTGHNPIQICPCCESCPSFAPFKKAQKVMASNFNRTNIDLNSHHCASWIITSIYEIILSTGGIALEQFNHVTSSRHPLVFPMWRVHTYRWLLVMHKSRNCISNALGLHPFVFEPPLLTHAGIMLHNQMSAFLVIWIFDYECGLSMKYLPWFLYRS